MKGDFSRNTFKPDKHYHSVLMQQGRVQLDADWNENLAIGSHLLQTLTRDVIGECGVPIHVDAFKIAVPSPIDPAQLDFKILAGPQGQGRMYVSGLLIEIEDATTYLTQPDWLPAPAGTTLDGLGPQLSALNDGETRVDRVYVDVWPRTISVIEDPHIREIALGGPDTAERVKLIWQVKVQPNVGRDARCNDPIDIPPIGGGTAQLIVSTPTLPPDPCEPTAQGGYQGPDNRFYRIEIHDGGSLGTATFKWSRDNGSVVAAVQEFKSSTEVVVKSLGRDDYLKFKTGDFVEVADDATELSGLPGTLAKITVDEASRTLTLSTALPDAVWQAADRHPKVRRWDGGDAQVITAAPIDIEAGLTVQFGATPINFRSGDYWTFAARVVDGSLDPMLNTPTPPMGVRHAFCALALITWTRTGETVTADVEDCRLTFPPLTEIPRGEDCCTVSVGDGVTSRGEFTDIQAAIDSLKDGGRVCILPGQYHLQAAVGIHDNNVIVSGCGPQTRITAPDQAPAFIVKDSNRVTLESLAVIGQSSDGVIMINTSRVVRVTGCEITNVAAGADHPSVGVSSNAHANGPAINISDSLMITITNNTLFGLPAVSSQAQIVEIDDNRLMGGGIWARDGSGQVEIHANDISRGLSAGIILGGLGNGEKPPARSTGVEDVQIFDNRISHMAGSGISTLRNQRDPIDAPGSVSDVTISDNRIVECVTAAADTFTNEIALGGIVLRDVAHVRIHHNMIANNGAAQGNAANGIFTFLCAGLTITDNAITDNGSAITGDQQSNCIDFSAMDIGEGDNPRIEAGATFTVFDLGGTQSNQTHVRSSGLVGLDCGFKTEIRLDVVSPSVEVTLISSSELGFVEAFNQDGSSAGTVQMPVPPNQPHTITLRGDAIQRIIIVAPQNKLLLQKICVETSGAGFQAGIAALFAIGLDTIGVQRPPAVARSSKVGETIPAAFIHDNVVSCPQGHALIVIGIGAMSITDNTLMSRGIRRQPDLPILAQGQAALINALMNLTGGVLIYNLGQPRELAGSIGSTINTHFEAGASSLNAAASAGQLRLPEGRILFNDNQVTLQDVGVRAHVPSAVLVLSGDDVSMQDNQISTEIPQTQLLIDVAVRGATLRMSSNRIIELPLRARLSCYSFGQFNITTENQTTHCLVAQGGQVIKTGNQQLITTGCEQLTAIFGGN